jgi:hypothetical protein
MQVKYGGRSGLAVTLVTLSAFGLALILVIAGLGAAAEAAALVGLIPVGLEVINRARHASAVDLQDRINLNANLKLDNVSSPIPGAVFRSPLSWDAWLNVLVLGAVALIGTGGTVDTVASGQAGISERVSFYLYYIMAVVSLLVLHALFSGMFGTKYGELLDVRPKLIITSKGIHYRWNSRRSISCSWEQVVKIRASSIYRDQNFDAPLTHLVLVVALNGEVDRKESYREVILCQFDYENFPRDGIRAAIASFEPALVDRSL